MKIPEITQRPAHRSGVPFSADGIWRTARALWQGLVQVRMRRPRNLRLCESLSLGDRRFVAVIAYEQSRFLLGGTSASLVLLAQLGRDSGEQVKCDTDAAVEIVQEPRC